MSATQLDPRAPLLISFSGLDGSGKSTQIESLRTWLHGSGQRVLVLTFWDDIVVGKRYREGFVHKVYKSEKGIGTPGKPVRRRDKNVRAWYLSLARHFLYLLDACHLFQVVARVMLHDEADVIIVDRYLYDELANLSLGNPLTRAFVRMLAASVPQPHIAYFLDADIEAAYARKPEYPIDFMHESRHRYFALIELLGNFTVIPPLPLSQAKAAVLRVFAEYCLETAAASIPNSDAGNKVA